MICIKCKEDRKEIEFNWRKLNIVRNKTCKECHRKYLKAHYKLNKAKYKSKAQNNQKKYYIANRNKILQYLSDKRCIDCGIDNILVLEFDHVSSNKSDNVCSMLRSFSWLSILSEINKCDIVCSNCHQIRTHKRANDYKWKYAVVAQQQRHISQKDVSIGANPINGTKN